jgi:hypothetical protein
LSSSVLSEAALAVATAAGPLAQFAGGAAASAGIDNNSSAQAKRNQKGRKIFFIAAGREMLCESS